MTVLIVNRKYITLSVKLQSCHKGRDVTIKHINVPSIYCQKYKCGCVLKIVPIYTTTTVSIIFLTFYL